jgi:hypothetical protein
MDYLTLNMHIVSFISSCFENESKLKIKSKIPYKFRAAYPLNFGPACDRCCNLFVVYLTHLYFSLTSDRFSYSIYFPFPLDTSSVPCSSPVITFFEKLCRNSTRIYPGIPHGHAASPHFPMLTVIHWTVMCQSDSYISVEIDLTIDQSIFLTRVL